MKRAAWLGVAILFVAVAWHIDADPVRLARGCPGCGLVPAWCRRTASSGRPSSARSGRSRSRCSGPGWRRARSRSASCRRGTCPRLLSTTRCARRSTSSAASTRWSTLLFVAAVGLGPFPMLAVVAYTTTSSPSSTRDHRRDRPGARRRHPRDGRDGSRCSGSACYPSYSPVPLLRPLPLPVERPGRHGARLRRRGGIGLYLQTYLRMIDYPAASTVLLVTVVMVMVVDFASARIRARLSSARVG